tara:strand:+ start:42 stop:632 length:591 start_codon:yes stop_codon:yes gene_type:complete
MPNKKGKMSLTYTKTNKKTGKTTTNNNKTPDGTSMKNYVAPIEIANPPSMNNLRPPIGNLEKNMKGKNPKTKMVVPKKGFDFKSEKTKNKRNYNSKSAEQISEEVTMSALKGGMPRNYNGMTKNFAMKNEMLSDSAKNRVPMTKNYEGIPNKYWTAIKEAAKGSNLTTAKQRYNYSLKDSKKKEAEAEANANNTKK